MNQLTSESIKRKPVMVRASSAQLQ